MTNCRDLILKLKEVKEEKALSLGEIEARRKMANTFPLQHYPECLQTDPRTIHSDMRELLNR